MGSMFVLFCYTASWEHSLLSLQKATCLQKFLYPSLGNVTRQPSAATNPICCAGSFPLLQWPRQGDRAERDRWVAVGGPGARAQCQQAVMQLKTHIMISWSVFSRCTVRINKYSRGKNSNIKTKSERNLHPLYKLQVTIHFQNLQQENAYFLRCFLWSC